MYEQCILSPTIMREQWFSFIDQLYFFAKIMSDIISEFYSNINTPT